MFERIVIPVDLTDQHRAAVEMARDLARTHGSTLTLLHVIETLDVPFDELKDFYERLEEQAREGLARLARPLTGAGVDVEQVVRYGKRAREIVGFVEEQGADLVVIGSHRPDPEHPQRTLLTISHQVAIFAPCPVLVVKGP